MIEFRKLMNGICFETGWSQDYAYELYMIDIYDVLYRDLEYFPSGPADWKKDREAKIKALRG
jgi:hypothetical protein